MDSCMRLDNSLCIGCWLLFWHPLYYCNGANGTFVRSSLTNTLFYNMAEMVLEASTRLPACSLPRASQSDIPDPVKVSLVVHHQALLRNKRCLLTYLKWRADRYAYAWELVCSSVFLEQIFKFSNFIFATSQPGASALLI